MGGSLLCGIRYYYRNFINSFRTTAAGMMLENPICHSIWGSQLENSTMKDSACFPFQHMYLLNWLLTSQWNSQAETFTSLQRTRSWGIHPLVELCLGMTPLPLPYPQSVLLRLLSECKAAGQPHFSLGNSSLFSMQGQQCMWVSKLQPLFH